MYHADLLAASTTVSSAGGEDLSPCLWLPEMNFPKQNSIKWDLDRKPSSPGPLTGLGSLDSVINQALMNRPV